MLTSDWRKQMITKLAKKYRICHYQDINKILSRFTASMLVSFVCLFVYVCLHLYRGHSSRSIVSKLHIQVGPSPGKKCLHFQGHGSKVKVTQPRPLTSCEIHSGQTAEWIWTNTYTNAYCTWETKWLRLEGHRVKGKSWICRILASPRSIIDLV